MELPSGHKSCYVDRACLSCVLYTFRCQIMCVSRGGGGRFDFQHICCSLNVIVLRLEYCVPLFEGVRSAFVISIIDPPSGGSMRVA